MRINSGVTDQYVYFIAVDATDFTSRETGLSSFTVYRSRNGAAAAAMTTPTINETDSTNMPGVYELLADEDMTIGAGNDTEEMIFHITHAGMAPTDRTIELVRPKITIGNTLGVASDGDVSGNVDGSVASVVGHTAQSGDSYSRLGAPAGASVSADILALAVHLLDIKGTGFVKDDHSLINIESFVDILDDATSGNVKIAADAAAILLDTNELQLDDVPGLIAALQDISTTDVLTQVNAALDTAIAELGVAAPTATPTLRTGLMLLYMMARNKTVVQTSGTDALEVYNDAGTKITQKLLTDDGSDMTEAEMS